MNPLVTENIMVDIESYGRRPGDLVVSIGAVVFSSSLDAALHGTVLTGRPEHEFHAVLSFDEAERESRFGKEAETMRWWREDAPVAFVRLREMMHESKLDVRGLMVAFTDWLRPFCEQGYNVVGNSPRFDLSMIEHACLVTDVPYPVHYRAEADYRMLTDLMYGPDEKPRPGPNMGHDALADAKFQALVYAKTFQTFETWRELALRARAQQVLG